MKKQKIFTILRDYFFVILGLTIFTFGWTAFLIPSKIIGGGVAGISTLLFYSTAIPVSVWYLLINVFLVILGMKTLGKRFALNTIFGILVNTLLFTLFQRIFTAPLVNDQFMAALIGGGLAGVGLGIAFANGGNSGGTDIIALVISHYRNISPGRIILYIDVFIIASSFIVFKSVEKIVYGYVVMAVVSYTLDLVLEGQKQSFQIFVFSYKNQRIAQRISNEVGRGVTLWKGYGWYSQKNIEILLVISRKHDKTNIMKIIYQEDSEAFVSVSAVQAVFGKNFEKIKV